MGFEFDMRWADGNGVAMTLNENTFVMLLSQQFYKSFSGIAINNTAYTSEVTVALEVEDRASVDGYTRKAAEAGAERIEGHEEMEGEMYGISFADADGHLR